MSHLMARVCAACNFNPEPTEFQYRQRRPVDLTELPTSGHWQLPLPPRSPHRATTGLQRPMRAFSCPLARVDAPAVTCTRTWTLTGVTATAVYTRRVQTTVTRRYTPRYTPVRTTGVYWSRRRYLACHLTRLCTDLQAETAHGGGQACRSHPPRQPHQQQRPAAVCCLRLQVSTHPGQVTGQVPKAAPVHSCGLYWRALVCTGG